MLLSKSTADEDDYSITAGQKLKERIEVNVAGRLGVEAFSITGRVMHVMRGKYGLPPPSRPLPWQYHGFYINSFYRHELPEVGSRKSKE